MIWKQNEEKKWRNKVIISSKNIICWDKSYTRVIEIHCRWKCKKKKNNRWKKTQSMFLLVVCTHLDIPFGMQDQKYLIFFACNVILEWFEMLSVDSHMLIKWEIRIDTFFGNIHEERPFSGPTFGLIVHQIYDSSRWTHVRTCSSIKFFIKDRRINILNSFASCHFYFVSPNFFLYQAP